MTTRVEAVIDEVVSPETVRVWAAETAATSAARGLSTSPSEMALRPYLETVVLEILAEDLI